jgi:hypothetical protein
MERLKRNPTTWGLMLGGAIVVASTFFAWLEVENRGGDAVGDRLADALDTVAIDTVAGQTILFTGAVTIMCGLLVTISLGKGKYVWATLGLLASGVVAATALWGLVDADGLAARFADVEEFSTTITISPDLPGDVVSQSFDEGTPSARAAIGLFIGLGGGVLAVQGAFRSYRFTPPAE